ncbi:MAG: rRNA maturation RNase YbeY [Mariprofundaceae bacterium]
MIDVLIDEDVDEHPLPSPASIRQAALAALTAAGFEIEAANQPELCIRFAADADIRALNRQWRNKDQVTDVLSFPLQEGPDFDISQGLGDIALAVPFILTEAGRMGLAAQDHCLHLIVHACLHLVGFDHIRDADAAVMQPLERQAMLRLGLHDPYPNSEEETL